MDLLHAAPGLLVAPLPPGKQGPMWQSLLTYPIIDNSLQSPYAPEIHPRLEAQLECQPCIPVPTAITGPILPRTLQWYSQPRVQDVSKTICTSTGDGLS